MIKKIRNVSALTVMLLMTGFAVQAGGGCGKECKKSCCTKTEAAAELKDHTCTQACTDAGKCVIVCGEKGHECTDACKHE